MSASRTVALITGANRGIGRATALALARDHNYTVILGCRDFEAAQAAASELTTEITAAAPSATPSFIPLHLVLESDTSIAAAKDFITTKFNHLDVLVNNVGILIDNFYHKPEHPARTPRELFDSTFQANVIGPAVLTEALLPLLRASATETSKPRIVFMTSAMGSLKLSTDESTPWHNNEGTAYDSSKAAVNMLAVNYARRLKDDGGKVNAVCPGLVATRMTGGYGTSTEEGARHVVEMATVGVDGPSGTFSNAQGELPW